jgi:hypothetical protein
MYPIPLEFTATSTTPKVSPVPAGGVGKVADEVPPTLAIEVHPPVQVMVIVKVTVYPTVLLPVRV